MKNSIKRAQSRAGSSFAERENFRPKVKHLKKTLLTLVALLALTTGARAQWTGGTYTATGNEKLNTINVSDDATLTINQGVTVTVTSGIVVADGKTLTITGGGTLVAKGADRAKGVDGDEGANGQHGIPGGTAIAGNVIINGVGLTVTATGGQGGEGGNGGYGSDGEFGEPGEPGSNGGRGGNGGDGGRGGDGGSAFSGAVTIYAGSVTATGGLGGRGGNGGDGGRGGRGGDNGGWGGDGGDGGNGGNGGNGGYAFAGTLTVFGGNVNAYGGNGGEFGDRSHCGQGGEGGNYGEPGSEGRNGDDGRDGAAGYAYANSVTFEAATYTLKDNSGNPIDINNITSKREVIIESADVEPATATPVDLTRGTGEKINEWTLTNGMPAGNVTVSVEYFPQAEFAMSTDATPVALAPKASTSARANTDDPLVEGGTVAGIVDDEAVLEEGQGTLLYHFSAKQLDADALEALTATDWTDKVPTADGLAEGTVYVYYYIKGADDQPGITPGAKFTFSDSDIQELAVTLAPEPTYDVEFAEGTNPEAPAKPEWTASPATDVKKGQTVTVTYSGDRKIIGVKAEKKSAEKTITIGEQNYTVQKGETWKQFITRNQLSGWSVARYTDTTWRVRKDNPSYTLLVSSDGINWEPLELTSEDAPIDTDKQYTLGLVN